MTLAPSPGCCSSGSARAVSKTGPMHHALQHSGVVRVRFCVRFQVVKVSLFGGFPVENPTKKATGLKGALTAISLSEYGSERFRVRLRRLSEYGSVAYLVERPTRETGRTVFGHRPKHGRGGVFGTGVFLALSFFL